MTLNASCIGILENSRKLTLFVGLLLLLRLLLRRPHGEQLNEHRDHVHVDTVAQQPVALDVAVSFRETCSEENERGHIAWNRNKA